MSLLSPADYDGQTVRIVSAELSTSVRYRHYGLAMASSMRNIKPVQITQARGNVLVKYTNCTGMSTEKGVASCALLVDTINASLCFLWPSNFSVCILVSINDLCGRVLGLNHSRFLLQGLGDNTETIPTS